MIADLVSVVLPIYKVEKYLNRCIESVVNQTYSNLEIILVDDGSPDSCPNMCDEWKKKDSRIVVIHKENGGLGEARNSGISAANGKYICFFDSDDYVSNETIEKAVAVANDTKADIVTFGYATVDSAGSISRIFKPETKKDVYRNESIENEFLPDLIAQTRTSENRNILMSACTSLYSTRLIKEAKWKFVSEREIIAEDLYSLLILYKSVKCVSILHESLYYYCENKSSLTHTYREDRYERIKEFYVKTINKAMDLGYSSEIVERIRLPYYSFTIAALKLISHAECPYRKKREYIGAVLTDEMFGKTLKHLDLKEEGINRKILWLVMKMKWVDICYVLTRLR
ncbi:glycosyltransferase family 2 protein [Ruminococcus sp. AF41-9]|nr:glycosyltransferase family 2 protein [Ruminococcus sp. AF41-9]